MKSCIAENKTQIDAIWHGNLDENFSQKSFGEIPLKNETERGELSE